MELVASQETKLKTSMIITLVLWLIPVIFSFVDRYIFDYPIGPLVPIYSIVAMLISFITYASVLSAGLSKVVSYFLSLVVCIVGWVLMVNYFMWLTHVFGVKDYV